jgi:hypothetical protein
MARRFLGDKTSTRRRKLLLVPIFIAVCTALLFTVGAQAVHNEGYFELGPGASSDEGGVANILGNNTNAGPDWADLFTATAPSGTVVTKKDANSNGTPDCEESPGKECAFIADASSAGGALDPTTFSGFGTSNKNNDPISGPNTLNGSDCQVRGLTAQQCAPWGWDKGNVPAKDDLTNVYAYEVVPTSGPRKDHVIIYGGLEREDPSGDSYVDLEFFKNKVDLCRNSSGVATPTCFKGVRSDGDIIVSMNFVKGGGIGSIEIREFSTATNSYGNPLGSASGQGCFNASGASGDDICAFINGASIDGGPWANRDNHGNVITSLQKNSFTEMGIDVTNVLGESPCISTFMGKTRSSASFTSELKDFAGPTTFSICEPSTKLSKSVDKSSIKSGESVTYSYVEENDGKDALTNVSVTDDKCSPLVRGADSPGNNDSTLSPTEKWTFTCSTTLSATTTNTALATGFDALLNKTVRWCNATDLATPPSGVFCDQDERAQATVTVINPSTVLTKTASAVVTYHYSESNDGDAALTPPTATDRTSVLSDDNCATIVYVSGDTGDDMIMGAGETWLFTCQVTLSSASGNVDVTNTATGDAIDPLGGHVTYPGDPDERDSVTIQITNN